MSVRCALLVVTLVSTVAGNCTCNAQEFLSGWFDPSDRAKAGQPHWMTPVVTVTPRLEQEFRTDFVIERTSVGSELVNFANSKGLELIPSEHVELILNVPPSLQHNEARLHDGSGDVSFWVNTGFLPVMRIVEITS
jgi:hypothetical protein